MVGKKVEYSLQTGIWKSIKNMLVVMAPALIAGWAAFQANLPADYQAIAVPIGGFIGYFLKNLVEIKG